LNTYFIYSAKVLATTDCMAGQTWSWTGLIWNCAQKISLEYPMDVLKHPDKTGNISLSELSAIISHLEDKSGLFAYQFHKNW